MRRNGKDGDASSLLPLPLPASQTTETALSCCIRLPRYTRSSHCISGLGDNSLTIENPHSIWLGHITLPPPPSPSPSPSPSLPHLHQGVVHQVAQRVVVTCQSPVARHAAAAAAAAASTRRSAAAAGAAAAGTGGRRRGAGGGDAAAARAAVAAVVVAAAGGAGGVARCRHGGARGGGGGTRARRAASRPLRLW